MNINLFGTTKPAVKEEPVDLSKQWRRNLQKEARSLERDIDQLKRAETKALKECKDLAKKGHTSAIRILASEIAQTRKQIERMHTAKAQLNSVAMQLQTTSAMMKLKDGVAKSASIMQTMNGLMNMPELSKVMQQMAREMEKAGLIDEIVSDTFASIEPESLEADTDAEVDRIMQEVTAEIMSKAQHAPTSVYKSEVNGETAEEIISNDQDLELKAMQDRLHAL